MCWERPGLFLRRRRRRDPNHRTEAKERGTPTTMQRAAELPRGTGFRIGARCSEAAGPVPRRRGDPIVVGRCNAYAKSPSGARDLYRFTKPTTELPESCGGGL